MPTYRFSFLDMMARLASEQQFQAADDAEALVSAKVLAFFCGVEVSQDTRRVGVVLPNGHIISFEAVSQA